MKTGKVRISAWDFPYHSESCGSVIENNNAPEFMYDHELMNGEWCVSILDHVVDDIIRESELLSLTGPGAPPDFCHNT